MPSPYPVGLVRPIPGARRVARDPGSWRHGRYARAVPRTPMQVPPNSDLTLGMVCTDKSIPGQTTWQMSADERFSNPAGILQGGFVAAFADSAMGASAVTWVQGRPVLCSNAEMKISFLQPVSVGTELTCSAHVVSGGTRVAFVEASVTDSQHTLVARATSTYLYRDRKNSPTDGR